MEHSLAIPSQSGDRNASESFLSPDPAHPFVRLPFDAHARGIDTERGGKASPDSLAVGRDPRRLGDYAHVDLIHAVAGRRYSFDSSFEHFNRVAVLVGGIGVRKHFPDVTQAGGAENGIGDGVTDGTGA